MLAFARKSAGPAVRGLQQARPRGIAVVTSHSQLSNALRPTCLSVSLRHNQQASAESHKVGELDHVRRRLLYRSKQRGWREMDIMLGKWVRLRSAACLRPKTRAIPMHSFPGGGQPSRHGQGAPAAVRSCT